MSSSSVEAVEEAQDLGEVVAVLVVCSTVLA